MKKLLLASLGFLCFGFFASEKVKATIYTHNLIYTHTDNGNSNTLSGIVTFQDSDSNAQDTVGPNVGTLDTGFITDITFTYTASGTSQTINYSDFVPSDGAAYRINHGGSVDFSSANLKGQLTDLAFQNSAGDFQLSPNFNANFSVDVNGTDDFLLSSTTYHSPGPLPFLGLLTAFSNIKKLKKKFKDQIDS